MGSALQRPAGSKEERAPLARKLRLQYCGEKDAVGEAGERTHRELHEEQGSLEAQIWDSLPRVHKSRRQQSTLTPSFPLCLSLVALQWVPCQKPALGALPRPHGKSALFVRSVSQLRVIRMPWRTTWMDTSFSAPRTPSPLSDLTLPGMCTETYFHTYTHSCTDIHLGLMPLFQHWGTFILSSPT